MSCGPSRIIWRGISWGVGRIRRGCCSLSATRFRRLFRVRSLTGTGLTVRERIGIFRSGRWSIWCLDSTAPAKATRRRAWPWRRSCADKGRSVVRMFLRTRTTRGMKTGINCPITMTEIIRFASMLVCCVRNRVRRRIAGCVRVIRCGLWTGCRARRRAGRWSRSREVIRTGCAFARAGRRRTRTGPALVRRVKGSRRTGAAE